jgi:hypothetical protein
MTTTGGMKAGGYYDHHSEYQQRVAATGAELIRDAVSRTPALPNGESFVIADYGCSTGKSSAASMRTAVDAVRAAERERAIAAIHNDVPTNDWNTLFANLAADPDGYAHAAGPPVVPLASAVSFFEAAAPAGSVHLGMSFSAAHWLRTQPDVSVPGFYFCEATGDARDVLAAQADADWARFFTMRAHDLASGARVVVQCVGTATPEPPAEPQVTARALLRAMAEVAATMADEGLLDPAAVDAYVLPVYARTTDEARRPLEVAGSDLAAAFAVETVRTDPVANPYLDAWRQDHDVGAYGKAYAAFVRGFTESSLREHLFTPGARGLPVDELLDDYFARLEARFAADPEADAFEDWTLTVVVARR